MYDLMIIGSDLREYLLQLLKQEEIQLYMALVQEHQG